MTLLDGAVVKPTPASHIVGGGVIVETAPIFTVPLLAMRRGPPPMLAPAIVVTAPVPAVELSTVTKPLATKVAGSTAYPRRPTPLDGALMTPEAPTMTPLVFDTYS